MLFLLSFYNSGMLRDAELGVGAMCRPRCLGPHILSHNNLICKAENRIWAFSTRGLQEIQTQTQGQNVSTSEEM